MKVTKGSPQLGQLPSGSVVFAASQTKGMQLLTQVDDFVRNQSRFDRQARLNLRYTVVEVGQKIYLDYVRSQVMPWQDDEIAALKQIFQSIAQKFALLKLNFPAEVFLVKTTGQEEGHAAYTRQHNVIVLPVNMISSIQASADFGDPLHSTQNLGYLEDVIIHEFFHIFSKNNAETRAALYQLVGYKLINNAIELPNLPYPEPNSPLLPSMKITNPDTPINNAIIQLKVGQNSATDANKVDKWLCPILVADKPYNGGIFFDYLAWYFMAVEEKNGQWQATIVDGKPLLYPASPLMPEYLKKIGYNLQGELFHPDEVMAQNFVFVANQPSLDLLLKIKQVL